MKERKINLGKRIQLIMLTHYMNWEQFIFGFTANYENEYFNNATRRPKIELNLWLFIISFHIVFYGNNKEFSRREKDV